MDRVFNVVSVFNDVGGLLGIKSKVKVRNSSHLSYVYSPGVGACCMEIKNDPAKADVLTNRTNSALVISDSSGFKDYDPETWVQDQVIPYLESKAVYYKIATNIDAYPLLFDHSLTKSAEDLHYSLDNLTNAYVGIQLYGVAKDRLAKLKEIAKVKKLEAFIVTDELTDFIEHWLQENHIDKYMSVNNVVACVLRVGMDNKIHGFLEKDLLFTALERFRKINNPDNHDVVATLHLINELSQVLAGTSTQVIRNSVQFVQDYRVYRGERKPFDNYDYTHGKVKENSIYLHQRFRGVIETYSRINATNCRDVDKFFSKENLEEIQHIIKEDRRLADYLTIRKNYSGIITNGTAILGFGHIGSLAGMPVMEGKALLFKEFGGVNMMPICIKELNPDKVIELCQRFAPIFCSINLEDIKAPDCFKIERTLFKTCEPAIFHDDQHGTAIICVGALINSLKLLNKKPEEIKIVINGGGAAGISICKLLVKYGCKEIIVCDSKGAIYEGRPYRMNGAKNEIASITNRNKVEGQLVDVIKGAQLFIGVSVAGVLTKDMVRSMAEKPIVMALANPVPEILPEEAKEAGAFIICTGRSDYPNQVNNSLAFPGIFRAIREARITDITDDMKLAASFGIAAMIDDDKITADRVIPLSLNSDVPRMVANIIKAQANEHNLIREKPHETKYSRKKRLQLVEADDF